MNVSQESLGTRILYYTTIAIPLLKSLVINHTKSSESMEKDATILLFQMFVELYHLKYTLYPGDGDSSPFTVVRETMEKTDGDSYRIEKVDCIGYIQK